MTEFIMRNLDSIIVIFAVLIAVVVLYFAAKGKYRKVSKRILLSLVVAAERQFGEKTGEVKFSYVAEKLHEKMPFIVQILYTEKDIANMIEDAVDEMKELLTNNPETATSLTGNKDS
jgi:hypothetical protein